MTNIEWTDATWNPIAGCSIVSPGCTNCYAMRQAARIERMIPSLEHYKGLTKPSKAGPVWTGKVALAPEKTLLEPLRRRKPTMYFVNSMSDLFHEDVPDAWIDRIFAVMALCPQHTFQVLTKRAERMRDYVSAVKATWCMSDDECRAWQIRDHQVQIKGVDAEDYETGIDEWPLPNVWLGVSCERQKEADDRIPHLLATPAAVRFVSLEPLLGPIELWRVDEEDRALRGVGIVRSGGVTQSTPHSPHEGYDDSYPGLDWVIVGGESGRDARPMHPDWARSIRDQCTAAGVAFFFKQWGEWAPHTIKPGGDLGGDVRSGRVRIVHPSGRSNVEVFEATGGRNTEQGSRYMARAGKKVAGRLLDGREWNEMPTIAREPGMEAA